MSSAGVLVRPVRRADVPEVWRMVGELAEFERLTDLLTGSQERLSDALFRDPPMLFGLVAESEGRLAGYALFHLTYSSFRTNPRMWLEDLWVEPSARGRGVGEALLRAFVGQAMAYGCHRVDWEVLHWNPAREFYEGLGAKPSDDGFLKYGLDVRSMRALLDGSGLRRPD